MSSGLQSDLVEDHSTDYELREAVLSSFRAEGHVQATLSGDVRDETYSVDADVKLQFRVTTANEIAQEADADFDLDWDGLRFVRYAKYMVNWETAEYICQYEFDPETGIVQPFNMQIDKAAERMFELESLSQDPGFLFPRRDPNDGPPPITEQPGTLITDDVQYQLRALNANDLFCIDWLPANDLLEHLSFLTESAAPLSQYDFSKRLSKLFHIGGGRPIVDSVDTVTQAAFARHKNGISLGLWFPYQPVPTDSIWELANDMGATRVSAAEQFPSSFRPQVPPIIWNCFPDPPRNYVQDPQVLNPCLIQLTIGFPNTYDSLKLRG